MHLDMHQRNLLCRCGAGVTLECYRRACAPEQQRPPQHGKKNGSFERTAYRSRQRHSTKFPLKSNPLATINSVPRVPIWYSFT